MDMAIVFINDFAELWSSGGILMWPLLFIAIFMYWNLFELFSRYSQLNIEDEKPSLMEHILEGVNDKNSMRVRMSILKVEYLPYYERRLRFLSILAGVSPLLGLLGTVMGMLNTFSVMNSGDVQKIDLMAGGISEALITTQMGLIIVVPALLMIMVLRGEQDKLKHFFEKMETECIKHVSGNKSMNK